MAQPPGWLVDLDARGLDELFDQGSINRGRAYARQRQVLSLQVSEQAVLGKVRGTLSRPYAALVTQQGSRIVTSCSCPIGGYCKHCVAVIITALQPQPTDRLSGALSAIEGLARSFGRGDTPPAKPQWQTVLEPLTRTLRPDAGTPLALEFWHDQHSGVRLRLMSVGRSGRWIKSDIDWQRLKYPMNRQFNERQRQALISLSEAVDQGRMGGGYYGGYWRGDDMLPMSLFLPSCWERLRAARAAGVHFLSGSPDVEIVLAERAASLIIDVQADLTGDLRLTARADADGELIALEPSMLIGHPPHGFVRLLPGRLALTPLERSLDPGDVDLFTRTHEVTVPAADAGVFAAGFLPALRRAVTVRDHDVELPEPEPPTLVAVIGVDDQSAQLEWAIRYVLGGRSTEVSLTPSAGDPPFRDADAERRLIDSIDDGPWWHEGLPGRSLVPARLTGRALIDFVSDTLPAWQARDDIVVRLSGVPKDYREAENAPEVRLSLQPPDAGHWFGLDVEVVIDGEPVPFADLFRALSLGETELVLESGLWFSLDRPELQQLRDLIAEAASLTDREPTSVRLRPEHAGLWEELVALGVVEQQSAAWQRSVESLLNLDRLPEVDPPASVTAELRPYQLTGFRWLSFLWQSGLGGILADEMGLGKTLQALSWVAAAKESGELTAPVLVVAPTSVIGTWSREAATFTPGLRVVPLPETTRRRGVPVAEHIADADIVITSYTLLRLDEQEFTDLAWSAVLLDEAQFVKNRQSQSYKAVRRLDARLKVALTGTPLENNLMDLWSMLSITAPGLFSDPKVFTELYRRPIESGDGAVLARLQRRIRPLILRRTKHAVATELPPKQEQVLEIELSPAHRRIYDRQLQRERQKVLRLIGDLDHNRVTVLRSLTLLRQLALSPRLIDPAAKPDSAKLDSLIDQIGELAAEGHRALVFSQFTSYLALVRERLDAEGISASYLDGRTRDRARRIEEFRTGDAPVFLISLKAGGFGLTLIEADYVFILDPWWNPAAENQAIDRTHRIGQTANVMVYRLVSANTIEQKVLDLQRQKRDLFDQVIGGADADLAAPLTADDIRGLLSD